MKKRVIIFGYGTIGANIATLLRKKAYHVIVVEPELALYHNAVEEEFEAYNHNLMKDDELLEIGIKKELVAFFCVSNSDKNNLFVTLSVRNLNKHVKIISTAQTKSEGKKMMLAGANKIINKHELGAMRVFRLLHKPLLLELFDNIVFSDSSLSIAEFTIGMNSAVNGAFLQELVYKNNVLILGILDKELSKEFIFNSSGINHKLDAGDTLVAIGDKEELNTFREYIEGEKKIL